MTNLTAEQLRYGSELITRFVDAGAPDTIDFQKYLVDTSHRMTSVEIKAVDEQHYFLVGSLSIHMLMEDIFGEDIFGLPETERVVLLNAWLKHDSTQLENKHVQALFEILAYNEVRSAL